MARVAPPVARTVPHTRAGQLLLRVFPVVHVLSATILLFSPAFLVPLAFSVQLRDGEHGAYETGFLVTFVTGLFFFLVGMGLYHRHRRDHHAPFMMLSLLPFLNPTLGRLIAPGAGIPVELVVMIVLLVRARRQQRPTSPHIAALSAFLVAMALLAGVMGAVPSIAETLHEWIV